MWEGMQDACSPQMDAFSAQVTMGLQVRPSPSNPCRKHNRDFLNQMHIMFLGQSWRTHTCLQRQRKSPTELSNKQSAVPGAQLKEM